MHTKIKKTGCYPLILSLLFFCCSQSIRGQMPVHIANFNHKNYKGGGIQNWGISISPDRILYCGNNNGLLRYNGNDWELFEPGERATVRVVRCIGQRVYTAGDNNIGYWEYGSDGKFVYTSLLPLVNALGISGETFWTIGTTGGKVYFHSFGHIIVYDGDKTMSFLVKDLCHVSLYQAGDNLYTQRCGGLFMQIRDDNLIQFDGAGEYPEGDARFMFQLSPGRFVTGYTNGNIYLSEGDKITLLAQLKNGNRIPVRIDCGSLWKDEVLAVGTIGDGLFLIDLKNDNRIQHIQSPRLQDFNIHGVCFAGRDFLWLSLDNGISSVTLNPVDYLWKTNTETGTFFDATRFDNKIYIATNQGLYLYDDDGKKIPTFMYPLQFCNLKDELLCGTTDRLYKMTAGETDFKPFLNINGVRQFEYMANRGDEYLFLRNYSGVSLLKYVNNTWTFLSALVNTEDYACIMPENLFCVWAIHPQKGIFRLRIDEELNRVSGSDCFTDIDGYSNYSRINMVKVEDKILFATPNGIYLYDVAGKTFRKHEHLSKEIAHLDKLQFVKAAYKNYIWVATTDELFLYHITDLSASLEMHLPFAGNELMLYDNHFNLKSIDEESVTFVSTSDGTVVIDNELALQDTPATNPLEIERFYYTDKKGTTVYVDNKQPQIELPNTATGITIRLTTGLQSQPAFISYRMPGVANEWSSWQTSGVIHFTNLPSGLYEIEVNDSNRHILLIPVRVSLPLYKRNFMIAIYLLLLVLLTAGIVWLVSGRKRKKLLEQYENEQKRHAEELQKQAYIQLQEKVTNQENELKDRMLFLTRKQELLDDIASEVEKQKKELGDRYPNKLYRRIMKIIQDGATEKDKLLSFENYFVEVHYEFMQRMQQLYPDLSPSELKFCCLLRANLSTKEISTVMGIALRSVELKKYRLKRKLNLDTETNLTGFILGV